MLRIVASFVLLSLIVTAARADEKQLITRDHIRLSQGGAQTILDAAQAKAKEMNLKVNIAIVDDGGHLLAFVRMDGARPASGYTAITKATAAATMRTATGPLPPGGETVNVQLSLALEHAAQATGGKMTTLFGGVPVEVEGQIIGAVGVGGATGEQDAQIARAGIAALAEALKK